MEGPDELSEVGEGDVSPNLESYQSREKPTKPSAPHARRSSYQIARTSVTSTAPEDAEVALEDDIIGMNSLGQDILIAVNGLGFHLEGVDASQVELKELLVGLSARVEAVASTLGAPSERAETPPQGYDKRSSKIKAGISMNGSEGHTVSEHERKTTVRAPGSINRGSIIDDDFRPHDGHGGKEKGRESQVMGEDEGRKTMCATGTMNSMMSSARSFIEVQEPLEMRKTLEECLHTYVGKSRSLKVGARHSHWIPKGALHVEEDFFTSRFKAWNPETRTRKILDYVGLLIVAYDAFSVPYWLAWQPDQSKEWGYGIWATCIFWTLYLSVQFVTGYRDRDARLELNPWRTAGNYLKMWFLLDLVVVICDWLSILNSDSRHFRYLRVMRLVRGCRQVLKFVALVQTYKLSSQFLEVHLSMDLLLLLLFILWVNHVVGCGWYTVGKNALPDTGVTWLMDSEFNAGHGPYYEYSTSLHWALTQMTPASMEVVPECTAERIYNLITILCSMLVFSSFGATLTSSLTQYRLHKERVTTNFMQLQTYLGQQGVEPELAMAIRQSVKNHLRKRQRLKYKSVQYLDYASKTLKEALWHSCCMTCIRQHAFLVALNMHDQSAVNALCNCAMINTEYSEGDIVFEVGGLSNDGSMHFIVSGRMFYDPGPAAAEAGRIQGDPLLTLGEGAFISEVAIWTLWKHLGTLFVEAPSEVFQLRGEKLVEALMRRFPETMRIVAHYCIAFHSSMHEVGCVRSDLAHVIDCHELMSALETPIRMELAKPILEKLRSRHGRFAQTKSVDMLEDELQKGKCNIGYEEEEPVRTVSVVAVKLRISFGDERFLVKVGEHMRSGDLKASCVLPGRKRAAKESARAAMERTCETDLAEIKDYVNIYPGPDKMTFMKDSPSYGVRTRYLRTTYNAVLSDECAPPMAMNSWESPEFAELSQRMSEYKEDHDHRAFRRSAQVMDKLSDLRRWCCARRFSPAEGLGINSASRAHNPRRAVEILARQSSAILLPCEEASKAKHTINLWLTQDEFDTLATDVATPVIKDWLSYVESSPSTAASARRRTSRLSLSRPSVSDMAPIAQGLGFNM